MKKIFLAILVLFSANAFALDCEFHLSSKIDSTSLLFRTNLDPGASVLAAAKTATDKPFVIGALSERNVKENSFVWVSGEGTSDLNMIESGDRQKVVAKNGSILLAAATASSSNDVITMYVKDWDLTIKCSNHLFPARSSHD